MHAKRAEDAGLKVVEAESKYSEDVAEGKIISQSPAAGDPVKPGTTIEVVTSRGSELTTVPNVIGMTEEQAIDKLQSEGFGADVKAREYSDKQGEGRVMKQDPLNDKVKPGATVQITISKAPSRSPNRNRNPPSRRTPAPPIRAPLTLAAPLIRARAAAAAAAARPTPAIRAATPARPRLPPTRIG